MSKRREQRTGGGATRGRSPGGSGAHRSRHEGPRHSWRRRVDRRFVRSGSCRVSAGSATGGAAARSRSTGNGSPRGCKTGGRTPRTRKTGRDTAGDRARRGRKEEDERREARRRAIGRQLDEEAARREAAAKATHQLPLSLSTARRARLWGRVDPNVELFQYAEGWARKIQFNTLVATVREVAKQPHPPSDGDGGHSKRRIRGIGDLRGLQWRGAS